ncbi:MAG: hypothetical protein RL514_143 [Verrucomicrobiota bacterium]|jgi:hypothetical protein
MPSVLRVGPYRFFFYAGDRDEPPHVHVERDSKKGKVWLDPVRLENSRGFAGAELRRILEIVEDNREQLLKDWNEYFGH